MFTFLRGVWAAVLMCLACQSGLFAQGGGGGLNGGIASVWGYHQFILGQKPEVPRVASVDLLPSAAFAGGDVLFHPRIRGNYGLFSTELRFQLGLLRDGVSRIRRNSFDWQLISFNLLQGPVWHLWLGTGISRPLPEGKSLSEHAMGLHVYLPQGHWSFLLEGRYATDYRSGLARGEGSAAANWWVLQSLGLDVALGAGAHWVAWPDRSEFLLLCGFRFNVN